MTLLVGEGFDDILSTANSAMERDAAATPGPWLYFGTEDAPEFAVFHAVGNEAHPIILDDEAQFDDLRFIANARTSLPALARAVIDLSARAEAWERMRPLLERLETQTEVRRLSLMRGGRHKYHDDLVDQAAEEVVTGYERAVAALTRGAL